MNKGFTLIELLVVIAVTAILSGIILFSITQYISTGKDSNIAGNLAVLIPAGENFYYGNGNSYNNADGGNFCDPSIPNGNSVIRNAIAQMPQHPPNNSTQTCYGGNSNDPSTWTSHFNPAGVCCNAEPQQWAACAIKFSDPNKAFCVDSRGVKEEMCATACESYFSQGGKTECPDPADMSVCIDSRPQM